MTDKKVLQIRILIAMATLIALSGILIQFFKNWSLVNIYTLLLLFSSITLAIGVSYLSEIFKKRINWLKISTGILSMIVFLFILFPFYENPNNAISWGLVIILSLNAIFISLSFLLEFFQKVQIMKIFSLVFASNSAIYSFFIAIMISRKTFHPEGGLVIITYSAVIFLFCIIANLLFILSLKNSKKGEQ